MAKYLIEDTTLNYIASAVRSKSGTSTKYNIPAGLIQAIMDIPTEVVRVENVTGTLNYVKITNSSNTNSVDLSNYIKDENFTLAFTIYNGSQWIKRVIAPTLVELNKVYSYTTTASSNGVGTLQEYWGSVRSENYGFTYSNGVLTCDEAYKFGNNFALIYVGKEAE